tara:strand:+ start:35 stop:175 length:141 start_codon:yes stop_codon:yes gene_type:complete
MVAVIPLLAVQAVVVAVVLSRLLLAQEIPLAQVHRKDRRVVRLLVI